MDAATKATTSPTAMDTTTDKGTTEPDHHPSAQSPPPPQTHAPGFEPAPTADLAPIRPRTKLDLLLLPVDVQATVCTKLGHNKKDLRLACKALRSVAAPNTVTVSFGAVHTGTQRLADAEKVAASMQTVKGMVINTEIRMNVDVDMDNAWAAVEAYVAELCKFSDEVTEMVKFWPQLERVEMPLNGQMLMSLVSSCHGLQSLTVQDDAIKEVLDDMLGGDTAGLDGMENLLPSNNVDHVFSLLSECNTITTLRLELAYLNVWPRRWELLGGMTQLKQLALKFDEGRCPDKGAEDSDEDGPRDVFGDGARSALLRIVRNVAKLVQLTDLELVVNNVSSSVTGPWSLGDLTNLTSLYFVLPRTLIEFWSVDAFQGCTQLRSLKLRGTTENPTPLLPPLHHLTKLDWDEGLILTDAVADVLATSCPALEYLLIDSVDISARSKAVLPALKVLQLRNDFDCRVALQQLAPELQLLDASHSRWPVILHGHPGLTALHVPYAWLPTEQKPATAARLSEMTALTRLHLTVKAVETFIDDVSDYISEDDDQAPEAFIGVGRLNRALTAGWAERIQYLQLTGGWHSEDEHFFTEEHLSVLFSSMPALRSIGLFLSHDFTGDMRYAHALVSIAQSCLSKMKFLRHLMLEGCLLTSPFDNSTGLAFPVPGAEHRSPLQSCSWQWQSPRV